MICSTKISSLSILNFHRLLFITFALLLFVSFPPSLFLSFASSLFLSFASSLFLSFAPSLFLSFAPHLQSVLLQTKLEEVTWHISETTFEFCACHVEVDMMKQKGGRIYPSSRRSKVRSYVHMYSNRPMLNRI